MDEVDMAPHILEVGKAHGTSVGTLLQVDGRAQVKKSGREFKIG